MTPRELKNQTDEWTQAWTLIHDNQDQQSTWFADKWDLDIRDTEDLLRKWAKGDRSSFKLTFNNHIMNR